MVLRNLPVLADYSDGDDTGPFRPAAAGDDVREGVITDAEYRVTEGSFVHDGTRIRQGFLDPSDDTIHAAWTQEAGAGAGSFSKSAGVTTITVNAGVTSEWTNGTYNARRLEMSLPSYRDWDLYFHRTDDGAINDQGTHCCCHFGGSDANFVNFQALRTGGADKLLVYRGVSTILYNINNGATASWNRMAYQGGTVYMLYFNGAIGVTPTEAQWIEIARYSPTWALHNVKVFVGALNIAGLPGCTPQIGPVTITYL